MKNFLKLLFPRTFYDKYFYLGAIPRNEDIYFKAIEPLIIFMDYKAKPWWCPRFVLRLLKYYGCGRSLSFISVKNKTLNNIFIKLTKSISFNDWKYKIEWYDLRIRIHADEQINELADAIEDRFYNENERIDLINKIKNIEPAFDQDWLTNEQLRYYYNEKRNG